MNVEDYARLRDHQDNNRLKAGAFNVPASLYTLRTVRGSQPSKAKARLYGTDGKLGKGRITGSTESVYNRRIRRSAEAQAIESVARSASVGRFIMGLDGV